MKHFLSQFLRSFTKWLVIFSLLFSVLFGLAFTGGWRGAMASGFPIPVAFLILYICYCTGWAGAMWRCGVENVAVTAALGASVPAFLSFAIIFPIHLVVGDASFVIAIAAPLAIFFFSWAVIAWSWFSMGMWGELWW